MQTSDFVAPLINCLSRILYEMTVAHVWGQNLVFWVRLRPWNLFGRVYSCLVLLFEFMKQIFTPNCYYSTENMSIDHHTFLTTNFSWDERMRHWPNYVIELKNSYLRKIILVCCFLIFIYIWSISGMQWLTKLLPYLSLWIRNLIFSGIITSCFVVKLTML